MVSLPVDTDAGLSAEIRDPYLGALSRLQRLHRVFLEVVKIELERAQIFDINNVQALILFNIGSEVLTIGDLTTRGYYIGSNVTYNVRNLVEQGYLNQERSTFDRRAVRINATRKGLDLCRRLDAVFDEQIGQVTELGGTPEQLNNSNDTLDLLERAWTLSVSRPR